MGLSRTGCFHVICIFVSKPSKKICQTVQYMLLLFLISEIGTLICSTQALLMVPVPVQRDVKGLCSVWLKGMKHRLAQFLFWSESNSWIETSWLSAKLTLLYYLSGLSTVHLEHLLPKRRTDFAQEHQTEPGGSTWLQWTTKSSQHQTLVQCFLSANAFHPVASFTSRLGLCLHLHLLRIKSLLPPPTW